MTCQIDVVFFEVAIYDLTNSGQNVVAMIMSFFLSLKCWSSNMSSSTVLWRWQFWEFSLNSRRRFCVCIYIYIIIVIRISHTMSSKKVVVRPYWFLNFLVLKSFPVWVTFHIRFQKKMILRGGPRVLRGREGTLYIYMGVSKNGGTPKSSILIGFSIINHPFRGTPIFGNTHIYLSDSISQQKQISFTPSFLEKTRVGFVCCLSRRQLSNKNVPMVVGNIKVARKSQRSQWHVKRFGLNGVIS